MLAILVPSSAKRIATHILIIAKLNGKKDIVLWGFVCDIIHSSKELSVQSYQLKHKNKMSKLCKIKNENTVTMSMATFQYLNCKLWTYLKLCSNCWLWPNKRLLSSYWKVKHFWRQDLVYHELCCRILNVNKHLLKNNIWTYTIPTLWVNEWEVLAAEFTSDIDSG